MQNAIIDQKANLIFDVLESLNLQFRVEASLKMINGTLFRNRFILGIDKSENLSANFSYICKTMNMPDQYWQVFNQYFADANMIYLGFEGSHENCLYKIYLELWGKIISEKNHKQPLLYGVGLKWNSLNNSQVAISKYTYYPLLSVEMILNRILNVYGNQNAENYYLLRDIIKFAANKTDNDLFTYLEVTEDNKNRKSFDINLYQANIQLKEVYHYLLNASQNYSISPQNFNSLYQNITTKILGHLSGGIDREGRAFITIYYEV